MDAIPAEKMLFRANYVCETCLRSLRRPRKLVPAQRRNASNEGRHRPLRLGIVGSGPAGFYAAARVRQRLSSANIDMYEKLPVPFGLVRYGVAPDHPEVKNCQDRFTNVAESSSGRFQYRGNIAIGADIKLSQMRDHYDALLFAYGASTDRLLGVPGEETLDGINSARAFVGWYNGLPEFADLAPNLDGEHAVVIGNGNVALDVARILLSDVDALRRTDINEVALHRLSKSRIKKVTIAGRRGPMQAAFTIKELRELVTLPQTAFKVDNEELIPSPIWISKLPRLEQRKYRFAKLLKEGAQEAQKECQLRSMVSPNAFLSARDDGALSHIRFRRNIFRNQEERFSPQARVEPTNETEEMEAQLAFRSIGYKAEPINGLVEDLGLDFDRSKGVITNDGWGRAFRLPRSEDKDNLRDVVPGCYCAGWVKNGPTGVIATTMEDAFSTADTIVDDWMSGREMMRDYDPNEDTISWRYLGDQLLSDLEKPGKCVYWYDWKGLDWIEKELGKESGGKPRSKITDVDEMMESVETVRNIFPAMKDVFMAKEPKA